MKRFRQGFGRDSVMSRAPLNEISARRVLLLKPSALGDIVHALPVLSALRIRFPEAHIAWVVNRCYAEILHGHPDLSAVLAFDRRGAWTRVLPLAAKLTRGNFDLVIDLQGLFRSAVMALTTRAPRRIGLASAREYSHLVYTDIVPDFGGLHAVDRYWRIAEALGVGNHPKRFRIPISDVAQAWAAKQLEAMPRPRLAIAAGSRWATKRWPAAFFSQLAAYAQRRFGCSAILIGTTDEVAISRAIRVKLPGRALDLTGKTTLPQLAAVLSHCDCALANDTGPMHLAGALQRPIIAPYTCTKAHLHGPYGKTGAVESRVPCQGSYLTHCGRMDCMRELTPDRLQPVLDEVFTRWAATCHSA
jgi:lipopolysaccharide heptosyltransferase I